MTRPEQRIAISHPVGTLAAVQAGEVELGGNGQRRYDEDVRPNTFIGQHILKDEEVLRTARDLVPAGALCVEIGPGPGTLTRELLTDDRHVIAYEIDKRWEPSLEALDHDGDLEVRWGSFLDAGNDELNDLGNVHIAGNIPFHISEPLMFKLAELDFEQAVLLVGDKLARSLTVENPDQPGWSRMSLVSQAYFNVRRVLDVPRDSFEPVPRANGALIVMTRKDATDESRRDATTQAYRALVEADKHSSTAAKALKTVLVDKNGQAYGGNGAGRPDKTGSHRAERRNLRANLRNYAAAYNVGGAGSAHRQVELPQTTESMLNLIAAQVDSRILSKPLSGISNSDLQKVCSAISSAVNQRKKH